MRASGDGDALAGGQGGVAPGGGLGQLRNRRAIQPIGRHCAHLPGRTTEGVAILHRLGEPLEGPRALGTPQGVGRDLDGDVLIGPRPGRGHVNPATVSQAVEGLVERVPLAVAHLEEVALKIADRADPGFV